MTEYEDQYAAAAVNFLIRFNAREAFRPRC